MSEVQIDVVALLREFAGPQYPDDICGKRCMGEAADEIARLRAALEQVIACSTMDASFSAQRNAMLAEARAALPSLKRD